MGAQNSSCLGEHSYITDQRIQLTRTVTGSDTASARVRGAFKLLPATAADVTLVTDDAVCSRAAQAFVDAVGQTGAPVRPVWVPRLGPQRYFVADGRRRGSSQGYIAVIFDEQFEALQKVLTF